MLKETTRKRKQLIATCGRWSCMRYDARALFNFRHAFLRRKHALRAPKRGIVWRHLKVEILNTIKLLNRRTQKPIRMDEEIWLSGGILFERRIRYIWLILPASSQSGKSTPNASISQLLSFCSPSLCSKFNAYQQTCREGNT